METLLQAIAIGIVQGLTEFLPISSSAHVILLPPILGWDDELLNSPLFVVMLHAGTLLALLAYFWRDVVVLLGAAWALLRERRIGGEPERRLVLVLGISILPAALLGVLLEDFIDSFFRRHLLVIPLILALGAAILWLAERVASRRRDLGRTEVADGILIGAAQALALFPGMSRSGITIAAGLLRGLEREAAARFAFLMGIPIIAGAGLWKARALVDGAAVEVDVGVLLAGVAAAAASGWLAIGALLRYLRTRSTSVFIAYRLVAAVVFVVLILLAG